MKSNHTVLTEFGFKPHNQGGLYYKDWIYNNGEIFHKDGIKSIEDYGKRTVILNINYVVSPEKLEFILTSLKLK